MRARNDFVINLCLLFLACDAFLALGHLGPVAISNKTSYRIAKYRSTEICILNCPIALTSRHYSWGAYHTFKGIRWFNYQSDYFGSQRDPAIRRHDIVTVPRISQNSLKRCWFNTPHWMGSPSKVTQFINLVPTGSALNLWRVFCGV